MSGPTLHSLPSIHTDFGSLDSPGYAFIVKRFKEADPRRLQGDVDFRAVPKTQRPRVMKLLGENDYASMVENIGMLVPPPEPTEPPPPEPTTLPPPFISFAPFADTGCTRGTKKRAREEDEELAMNGPPVKAKRAKLSADQVKEKKLAKRKAAAMEMEKQKQKAQMDQAVNDIAMGSLETKRSLPQPSLTARKSTPAKQHTSAPPVTTAKNAKASVKELPKADNRFLYIGQAPCIDLRAETFAARRIQGHRPMPYTRPASYNAKEATTQVSIPPPPSSAPIAAPKENVPPPLPVFRPPPPMETRTTPRPVIRILPRPAPVPAAPRPHLKVGPTAFERLQQTLYPKYPVMTRYIPISNPPWVGRVATGNPVIPKVQSGSRATRLGNHILNRIFQEVARAVIDAPLLPLNLKAVNPDRQIYLDNLGNKRIPSTELGVYKHALAKRTLYGLSQVCTAWSAGNGELYARDYFIFGEVDAKKMMKNLCGWIPNLRLLLDAKDNQTLPGWWDAFQRWIPVRDRWIALQERMVEDKERFKEKHAQKKRDAIVALSAEERAMKQDREERKTARRQLKRLQQKIDRNPRHVKRSDIYKANRLRERVNRRPVTFPGHERPLPQAPANRSAEQLLKMAEEWEDRQYPGYPKTFQDLEDEANFDSLPDRFGYVPFNLTLCCTLETVAAFFIRLNQFRQLPNYRICEQPRIHIKRLTILHSFAPEVLEFTQFKYMLLHLDAVVVDELHYEAYTGGHILALSSLDRIAKKLHTPMTMGQMERNPNGDINTHVAKPMTIWRDSDFTPHAPHLKEKSELEQLDEYCRYHMRRGPGLPGARRHAKLLGARDPAPQLDMPDPLNPLNRCKMPWKELNAVAGCFLRALCVKWKYTLKALEVRAHWQDLQKTLFQNSCWGALRKFDYHYVQLDSQSPVQVYRAKYRTLANAAHRPLGAMKGLDNICMWDLRTRVPKYFRKRWQVANSQLGAVIERAITAQRNAWEKDAGQPRYTEGTDAYNELIASREARLEEMAEKIAAKPQFQDPYKRIQVMTWKVHVTYDLWNQQKNRTIFKGFGSRRPWEADYEEKYLAFGNFFTEEFERINIPHDCLVGHNQAQILDTKINRVQNIYTPPPYHLRPRGEKESIYGPRTCTPRRLAELLFDERWLPTEHDDPVLENDEWNDENIDSQRYYEETHLPAHFRRQTPEEYKEMVARLLQVYGGKGLWSRCNWALTHPDYPDVRLKVDERVQ